MIFYMYYNTAVIRVNGEIDEIDKYCKIEGIDRCSVVKEFQKTLPKKSKKRNDSIINSNIKQKRNAFLLNQTTQQ